MYKFCPFCGKKYKQLGDTLRCDSCQKDFFINSAPSVAVIPIFNNEMLLSIRGIEPHKGKLGMIGGFLENGEDPLLGAVREFEEEAGYKLDIRDLEFVGIRIDDYSYQGNNFKTLDIFYKIKFDKSRVLTPNQDVVDLVWVPLEQNENFAFPCMNDIVKNLRD